MPIFGAKIKNKKEQTQTKTKNTFFMHFFHPFFGGV
jgi:hypothetical protein